MKVDELRRLLEMTDGSLDVHLAYEGICVPAESVGIRLLSAYQHLKDADDDQLVFVIDESALPPFGEKHG